MIILRVAEGRGLTRATMQQATTGFTTNQGTGMGKSIIPMAPIRFAQESTTFVRGETASNASLKHQPSEGAL
jgi:hypothetical protein